MKTTTMKKDNYDQDSDDKDNNDKDNDDKDNDNKDDDNKDNDSEDKGKEDKNTKDNDTKKNDTSENSNEENHNINLARAKSRIAFLLLPNFWQLWQKLVSAANNKSFSHTGWFFHWYPLNKFKYVKPRLDVSLLT